MKALSRWCTLVSAVLIFYSFSADSQQVHQTLARHVPPAVSTGAAKPIGPLPSTQRLNLSIVLPLRNQDQLTRLLNRLYDPSSTDYRHFLSVAEFTAQFGPKEQDFQAVVDYVQANGINVTDRPANRLVVPISGTVEQLQAAFHVAMKVYPHPTENRTFFSPDREPSLALNVPISHIAGLNNFSIPRQMVLKGPVVRSLVSDEAQGSGPGGSYLGSDMRAAYYGGTTLTGAGEVVGFLQFDGYNQSDVDLTFSNAGQSYSVPIQNVLLDGATGVAGQFISPADDAEQVLDIVQAIGMAPGLSQVRVYIGSIDADIFNKMASENVAKQLSVSWTWAPDDPSTDDIFFQEFAAQGQSIFVAAGDYGEYDPRFPSYYPAEDDDVTAVGGTTLVTTGPGGQWSSETAWSRSGGGISPDDIAIPPWQVGVATSSNGGSTTLRSVPDVAAEADFDNYDCDMGVCAGTWAGTSFASPRWAGFMALVNQQAEAAGDPPIGLVNQAIYGIGEGSSYAEDFHDITSGNNDYFGNPQQPSYYAVPGYDLVTGWGTPTGHPLIDSLAPWSKAGFLLTPSSNLITIASGSSASVAINVIAEDGFTGKVSLSYSGFPVGIVASWSTNPTSSGSALLLTAANAMTWGQFQITVTGTSGTLTASTTFVLNINAPGFQLIAANGSMRLYPGYADSTAINVVSNAGFNGRVVFSVSSPLPSGVSAIWSQDSDTGNSLLTLWPSNSASSGVTTVRITGVSGSFSATTSIVLDVMAPAILINMSPVPYGIAQGETVSSTITVIPEGSYSDPVSFSIYVPTGVSSSFDPVSATSSTTLTLTASPAAPSNAPVNTYTTVWGFDGDNDDFTEFAWTMTVMVPPIPVFDVTISPQYLTIPEGQSVAVNTTVTQRDGDSGSVA
ncbi:MAG: S53 family peptidase, partial [Terracidiphilus sp.]